MPMKAWSLPCCVLASALALVACSSKPPEPNARSAAGSASVATPFDAMKADKQRARDVQKMVDKQAAEQRKQIDNQTH